MITKRATLVALSLLAFACRKPEPIASAPERTGQMPVTSPAAEPAPAPAPPPPARIERVRVPGDLAVSVVRPLSGAAPKIVYLPGICSNANAYLQAFPEAARAHGGVVAIEGDVPCASAGFRSFSWDAARQHARIEAALAAAGLDAVPSEGITVVGYSQGAAIAEQLVERWPSRYARAVLIGAPTDPSPQRLRRARALVMMSCSRDVTSRMKQGAARATHAGVPSLYLEMPGCTHGQLAEPEATFGRAFDFLEQDARAPEPTAVAVPLTGSIEG